MTQTEQEQQEQDQPTTTVTFQTANELLNKPTFTTTNKKNTLFDNPLEMQLSRVEELIDEGYCIHCVNTKASIEKCRKITNKLNLFAHFCNVCTALFGNGTEFLTAMKSLDNFELLSLDEDELLTVKKKDRAMHDKIIVFKDQFAGRS